MLTRYTLKNILPEKQITVPAEAIFDLPEKVLQFGTGVLLRGLPDYFIDKANRQGIFNGRIVVVKSTGGGDASAFDKQDGLYTICVRGIEDDIKVEENIINASISRVVSARSAWGEVLKCAHNPEMKVVISNTTEVGITFVKDDIHLSPPVSFPGKLLSFLYERYKAFKGSPDSGLVIVPTELITENARKLEAIVLELAHLNGLEEAFMDWLDTSNYFCNSLVDRIVPGAPPAAEKERLQQELGYTDDLLIISEVYRLWAIETGSDKVKEILSFSQADAGVAIAPDITKFRELKLRLLNGTHTLSCALAILSGFTTVKEAMADDTFATWMNALMINNIIPAVVDESISDQDARRFAAQVLDRFRNPYLDHKWVSIAVQYSSKMKMRNLPLLMKYVDRFDTAPEFFALGFAAYLLVMKVHPADGGFQGEVNDNVYQLQDDKAAHFSEKWATLPAEKLVTDVLQDEVLWGTDLSELGKFAALVTKSLQSLMEDGAKQTMHRMLTDKSVIQS